MDGILLSDGFANHVNSPIRTYPFDFKSAYFAHNASNTGLEAWNGAGIAFPW
jgi:hypothetical protein